MEEVVSKIHREGAQTLLVLPEWTNNTWWQVATRLMAKSIYFPTGSRLFETDKGTSGPTRWGVRVVFIPKASPCLCSQGTQDILATCPRVRKHNEQSLLGDQGTMTSSHIKVAKSNGQEGEKHLKIRVGLTREGMKPVEKCEALIDTGAEVCLIRGNLVPEEFYQPAVRPLRLWAANKQLIKGGQDEVLLTLVVEGSQVTTAKAVELRLPTWFYVADIQEDIILSYEWCRLRGVDISARHHGLLCLTLGQEYWVEGMHGHPQPNALIQVIHYQTSEQNLANNT